MSISFRMTLPPGVPDPQERVSSFAPRSGNILTAVEEVGFLSLDRIPSPVQAQCALAALIAEIDKGEDGVFTADWWLKTDKMWSNSREFGIFCNEWGPHMPVLSRSFPGMTIELWYARTRREKLREDAFRWFSYYRMGITFEWSY